METTNDPHDLIPDDPKAGCPLGPRCGCSSGSAHWWYQTYLQENGRLKNQASDFNELDSVKAGFKAGFNAILRDQRNDILLAVNEALVPFGVTVARGTIDGEDAYEGMRMPTANGDKAEAYATLCASVREIAEEIRGTLRYSAPIGSGVDWPTSLASGKQVEQWATRLRDALSERQEPKEQET